ncbi:hypothetical protein [Flavobacterium hercynium]|nr:hypothetical protein [Flavobacterium hercynium]
MKKLKDTYLFQVNFRDNYDEFWIREDLEEISSSFDYKLLEESKVMMIAASVIYAGEIIFVLNQYNIDYSCLVGLEVKN